jgi:hypothetical protein
VRLNNEQQDWVCGQQAQANLAGCAAR